MVAHQRNRDRRDILGQAVAEGGAVGDMDLGDAGDLRRRLGDPTDAFAGDEGMDLAQLGRGGDRGKGGVLHLAAFMLDENQSDAHATTPRVLSLPISSSTLATLTPAWRLEGSTTLSTASRGVVSTP
jgi:hypothetical protein